MTLPPYQVILSLEQLPGIEMSRYYAVEVVDSDGYLWSSMKQAL
jgi:hypothetical protein